jgi:glycine/D-amino acid oxidase-like deaminating enzyme
MRALPRQVYDLVVNGGGTLGLWLVVKALHAGLSVCLIERGLRLAGGPSTRNEGWGHNGTYHSAAILDAQRAYQVAKQTRDGFRQIVTFAPEAIEADANRSFAVLKEPEAEATLRRWSDLRIPHRRVKRSEFDRLEPNIRLDRDVVGVYDVDDRSINTRIVYAKLAHCALQSGATLFLGSEIKTATEHEAGLDTPDGPMEAHAQLFVHTCGYGVRELFQEHLQTGSDRLPVGFVVSHLVDLPRACHHNVFYVAAGNGGVMQHGKWSIFGLNADGNVVDRPTEAPIPERADELQKALCGMFREVRLADAQIRACTKVFCTDGAELVADHISKRYIMAPQLGIAYGEPFQNHIWALPGKMTESPYMADRLMELVALRTTTRSGTPRTTSAAGGWKSVLRLIAKRPIDERTC